MKSASPLLEIDHLFVEIQSMPALRGFSMHVAQGAMVSLVGRGAQAGHPGDRAQHDPFRRRDAVRHHPAADASSVEDDPDSPSARSVLVEALAKGKARQNCAPQRRWMSPPAAGPLRTCPPAAASMRR